MLMTLWFPRLFSQATQNKQICSHNVFMITGEKQIQPSGTDRRDCFFTFYKTGHPRQMEAHHELG